MIVLFPLFLHNTVKDKISTIMHTVLHILYNNIVL